MALESNIDPAEKLEYESRSMRQLHSIFYIRMLAHIGAILVCFIYSFLYHIYPVSLAIVTTIALLFPFLVIHLHRTTSIPQEEKFARFEHPAVILDSILAGSYIALWHFAPVPSLVVILIFITTLIIYGGYQYVLSRIWYLPIGILIMYPITGLKMEIVDDPYVLIASFVLLSTHILSLVHNSYKIRVSANQLSEELDVKSKDLKKANKEISEQKIHLEKLSSKLSKYLSPQVYRSIFKGERDVQVESERKFLTIMFSDIVDFTRKTEEMGPGQLNTWLNNYMNEMAGICFKYNGTLDKFIGDAVLVFFGDPESKGKKEDAINCLKMATEMNEQAKSMGIDIRIGINSGECIVGNFGSNDRMDYSVIGPEVNLAARLESSSEPRKIQISSKTYELVLDQFACTERGSINLKGIEREVKTYWVS